MKIHTGCKRQFMQLSRSWYGSSFLPSGNKVEIINIGFYHPDGGTTGEFEVSWTNVAGVESPKLCAFDDSWNALYQFVDMLELMAEIDGDNISPNEFCEMLISLGIEDATQDLVGVENEQLPRRHTPV